MSKAILVLDEMPNTCEECKFNICYNYVDGEESTEDKVLIRTFHKCILTNIDGYDLEWEDYLEEDGVWKTYPRYDRNSLCPLKQLPERLNWSFINETADTDSFEYGRCVGRQELIDEIMGEEDD